MLRSLYPILTLLALLCSIQAGIVVSGKKGPFRRVGLCLCALSGGLFLGGPLLRHFAGPHSPFYWAAVSTAVSAAVAIEFPATFGTLRRLIPATLPGLAAAALFMALHRYIGGVGSERTQWAALSWTIAAICLPPRPKAGGLTFTSYKLFLPVEHKEGRPGLTLSVDAACAASDSAAAAVPVAMSALGAVVSGLWILGGIGVRAGLGQASAMILLSTWGLLWACAVSRLAVPGSGRNSLWTMAALSGFWLACATLDLQWWAFLGGVGVFLAELACSILIIRLLRTPWEAVPLIFLAFLGQPLLAALIPLIKGEKSLAAALMLMMPAILLIAALIE